MALRAKFSRIMRMVRSSVVGRLRYEPTIHDRWIGYALIGLLVLWHLLWFGAGALLF